MPKQQVFLQVGVSVKSPLPEPVELYAAAKQDYKRQSQNHRHQRHESALRYWPMGLKDQRTVCRVAQALGKLAACKADIPGVDLNVNPLPASTRIFS